MRKYFNFLNYPCNLEFINSNEYIIDYIYKIKHFKNGSHHLTEWDNGDVIKYKNKKQHSENGPAYIIKDTITIYCYEGEIHRTDGPAVEYCTGVKKYYLFGEEFTEKAYYESIKNL